MTNDATPDVIDEILDVRPGDRLDRVRRARPVAREQAQVAYEAIFRPAHPGALAVAERYAVAWAVAAWTGEPGTVAHYRDRLLEVEPRAGVHAALSRVIADGAGTGPFGRFREPGLAARSTDGTRLVVGAAEVDVLGEELSALLVHAHALTLRPREASPALLEALTDVGWEATEIVALSQLVAYVSFQARLVAGLRALRSTWEVAA